MGILSGKVLGVRNSAGSLALGNEGPLGRPMARQALQCVLCSAELISGKLDGR